MQEKNKLGLACVISIISTLLFSVWLIVSFILTGIVNQIVLIVTFISFIVTLFLLRKSIVEIRYEINNRKEKEKNIHDIYLYNQLLDPPSTNN